LKKGVIKHDSGIDITRIIAFLSVVGIHFLTFAGFNEHNIDTTSMYILTGCRCFLVMCVPIFLILTGYLQIGKDIKIEVKSLKRFYSKIFKVLLTYIFTSIFILIFMETYLDLPIGIRKVVTNILAFDQYAWYVEMYIGLFLLIPFLNTLWKGIEKKEGHLMLVVVLSSITFLPSLLNSFDLTVPEAFFKPWLGHGPDQVFPNWWVEIFPISYYYVGAYIRKYVDLKKLNSIKMFAIFVASEILSTAYCLWKNYSTTIYDGGWSGWQNALVAVTFFMFVNSIDYSKINDKLAFVLSKIAGLTLGAYLISWIPDQIFHKKVIAYSESMAERYMNAPKYYVLTVLIALGLAFVIDCIVKLIFELKECLVNYYRNKNEVVKEKEINSNKDIAS